MMSFYMDSDNSVEKTRKKFQHLPSLKFDNFEIKSGVLEDKSSDAWATSSRISYKKFPQDYEANAKHWAIVSEGFPPGVTVDELKNYGRRRQLSHLKPQDNLQLEEGSLKAYKSEYKRRFQAYTPLNLTDNQTSKKEKSVEEKALFPEFRKSFFDYPQNISTLNRPKNNLFLLKDKYMETSTEKNSQYIPYLTYEKRKLLRRSTALKPEGEMTTETEVRKEYKRYQNPEKAQLIRKLPSLKLEGEFETITTEQKDKYIVFFFDQRPALERKKTFLKMEGDFDFLTEKKLNYVPHKLSERPRVRKRSQSLKLDGELEFFPEYRHSFVNFPRVRPITHKPNGNIRYEGNFERETETKTKFVSFENAVIPESAKPENHLYVEGEMEITPEYKMNFVNFPRERPFLKKPPNQLKPKGNFQDLMENSKRCTNGPAYEKLESLNSSNDLKVEQGSDFLSENTQKFINFEKNNKPGLSKLNSNFKLENNLDFLTEKPNKFGFLLPEKEEITRRPSSLKSEKECLFLPEYRRFYEDLKKNKNILKPLNAKSNPTSPRKKTKEKKDLNLIENSKLLETPRRNINVNNLKENSSVKNLKFEIPNENFVQFEVKEQRKIPNENYEEKTDMELQKSLESKKPLVNLKEFSAFQVLDVKGQAGCQSMAKNILEQEKFSSDEESSTYRLEVTTSEDKGPGFYKNKQRVFPNKAVNIEELEAAEMRARQREENFVKVVKSPQVPNYLLEENNEKENRWRLFEKPHQPSSPNILKNRAFVVLDNGKNIYSNSSDLVIEASRRDTNGWASDWMSSSPMT